MLEAISAQPSSLTYASARLRDDDDIARAAVAQDQCQNTFTIMIMTTTRIVTGPFQLFRPVN